MIYKIIIMQKSHHYQLITMALLNNSKKSLQMLASKVNKSLAGEVTNYCLVNKGNYFFGVC